MTRGGYVNLITIFRSKCKSGVFGIILYPHRWYFKFYIKVFQKDDDCPHCPSWPSFPSWPHLTPGVAKLNWAIAWPGISVLEDRIRHCWLSLRLAPSSSDSSGQTTRILAPILVHVTRSHSHSRSGQSGVSVLHNHHPPPSRPSRPSSTSSPGSTQDQPARNNSSEERKL